MRVGVDVGGTFTDLVGPDGRVVKVPSSPAAPTAAVRRALAAAGPGRPGLLVHGTTVATNALLERRLADVTLVTTAGFEDVIEIARQQRPSLYDHFADRPEPLVPRHRRVGVPVRPMAHGPEPGAAGPDPPAVPALPAGTGAVAVVLLHADLHPGPEARLAAGLRDRYPGLAVCASSEVAPEFREYERTVTTVVNAALIPVCGPYLEALAGLAGEVLVMTSAGGLVAPGEAAARPAALLLSGPAAGARAAAALAEACGFPVAVAFDMGGTSTDTCLVAGGAPQAAPERRVAGLPIRLPALDVHTIGAGGGSIARIDAGGALRVGPRSAGADPGPACYGRGGPDPTVTDADLVAGRIPPGEPLAGITLDVGAARAALRRAGVDADGVIRVVEANMAAAVRAVTVARGVDPARAALVAYGGAGPLHAAPVAAALGMPAVLVPPRAGVFSAVGLLGAPRQRELVRSWPGGIDHTGLEELRAALAADAGALVPDATTETFFDCRYAGQSHELTVTDVAAFHAEHARRNGYARPDAPVEVVAVRARATGPVPGRLDDLPPPDRRACSGPAVLAEEDCTVHVPDGWVAEVGPLGTWILRRR
jgi:N-methylhydantoinase A/oxoprolinase/acetone carboxylase beta subunit